jgi:hypothetical protein
MGVFIAPLVALFTPNCHHVTFDPQVNIVLRYTGQFGCDLQRVFRFVDVHPGAGQKLPASYFSPAGRAPRGIFKEPIHFAMQVEERITTMRYTASSEWKDEA